AGRAGGRAAAARGGNGGRIHPLPARRANAGEHDFRRAPLSRAAPLNKKKVGGRRRPLPIPNFGAILTQLTLAGFALSKCRLNSATPAATLRPFCPSIVIGWSAIEFLKPPTRTLAPAPTPTAALAVAPA